MTSRLRFCLAVASSFLVFDALAQTPPAAGAAAQNPAAAPGAPQLPTQPSVRPAGPDDQPVTLKLPDADINTVLDALENLTGRMVLRPQQLTTATYNLKLNQPNLTKADAILAIETVLALNNIGIAPVGDKFIKIVNINQVRQEAPEMITGSAFDLPPSGRAATKLFQLEFARVAEIQPLLTGVVNPFYGGAVPLQNTNAFLLTDSISNLQRVEVLLQQVDKPSTSGLKPKFFTLKNGAKASDVVNKLRTILQGTLQTQLGQATTYSADDRTNQIIVVTDPRQWDFFAELIDRLDQRSDPNTRTEVLYLKNAKAADVVTVLGKIISQQTTAIQRTNPASVRPGTGPMPTTPTTNPATPNQPATPTIVSASSAGTNLEGSSNEFSGLMTVVNDDRSNAVVVFGTADDIRLVTDLVDKLDIVLRQVRIECVIAEVTLDDNDASGISALGLKIDGDKLVGFSASMPGPPGSSTGDVDITDGTITRPGTHGGFDLAATISVHSNIRKRNNSIITVPAIVTSHGKKATFFNGETRPIITGSVTSGTVGGTTSTTTQQQIGTTLTVTPYIGPDGSVQLELVTDVQDVTGNVVVDNNQQYIIGQRKTESYVTAKSGDIIVTSGFRKNTLVRERSRLGPIPIIGDIFGPRVKGNGRQELVFFLRPTVLTNNPAIDNADTMKRVEQLSTRDQIKSELDPNYQPPKKSLLDKILPK